MSVTTNSAPDHFQRMSLREQVESLLPAWESWYPSLFHAAEDLGLIRARVCSLSSLMLSHRHAAVHGEALQAFKDQWCVEDETDLPPPPARLRRRGARKPQQRNHSHHELDAPPSDPHDSNDSTLDDF